VPVKDRLQVRRLLILHQNLHWAERNLRLGHMRPAGRGLVIAGLSACYTYICIFSLQHGNPASAIRCGSVVLLVPGSAATDICFHVASNSALTLDAHVLQGHSGMGGVVFVPTSVHSTLVILVSESLCEPGALSQHKSEVKVCNFGRSILQLFETCKHQNGDLGSPFLLFTFVQ